MLKLKKYLLHQFELQRSVGGNSKSLIAALVEAEQEGERLDNEELVAMVFIR